MDERKQIKYILIILIILLIAIIYLGIKLFAIEKEIAGESSKEFISLSEDVKIIKANIFSCNVNEACAKLFQDRKYSCPSTLKPTCEDKFCICK